jgi:alpha-tubulin suppressor-like RCC1 family protein
MPSLSSGVRAVLVDGFACALSLAGGVKCWGPNAAGQLGNGSTESSDVPTDVIGLSKGVVALAVGVEHACAVTEAGAVKCWGEGLNDMLGSDPGRSSAVPKDVLF